MKKLLTVAALALAMGGAHAQGYFEGAFGITNVDAGCDDTVACDNDSTGLKLIGGYHLNPNLAIEVGYLNFGKAEATISWFSYADMDISAKSTAIYVGAALRGQLGAGFSAVGRLGLANVSTKISQTLRGFGSDSDSESSVNALIGFGLEYAVTKNVKVTGAIDLTKTAEFEDETADLRMISIGVKYDF